MNLSGISNRGFVGKLLRQPLRLLPAEMPILILQGKLKGKRWIVGSHTHGCWLGSYEHEKQRRFQSLIEPGNVIFDIGANVGFYTLLASVLVGPTGRVYAFEPLPRNIQLLNEHLRINRISNAEIIEAAVSHKSGHTHFDDSVGGAMGHVDPAGKLEVRTVKLDDIVFNGDVPLPDCMKIDVEGSELRVLTGATTILQARRPTIFLSTHGQKVHQECSQFLRALDYKLQPLIGTEVNTVDELVAFYSGER